MQKSFYFQHDYNASSDAKVLFLRQQLGMEGYGIYWFVLEQLAQAGGYLPLKIIPVLAMQSQTQETKVRVVIEGYGLFKIIKERFFSQRLNGHLVLRRHLSLSGKVGASIRWKDSPPISPPISPPNAKERKGKKGKERKEIERESLHENSVKIFDADSVKIFDAEELILKNQIQFERICCATGKNSAEGAEILHKYHLYLEEKEQYPKSKRALFAGFEKWMLNEKKFNSNGITTTSASNRHKGAMQLIASLKQDYAARGKKDDGT